MLKQKYFLTDFFILSAEKQPIKLSWRNIEWLQPKYNEVNMINLSTEILEGKLPILGYPLLDGRQSAPV